MPNARSVTTGVWVAVGGRDEAPGLAGASHFLEHLFFKGTETRSARAIAEAVDAVGGDLNTFTSREHTAFHTRLPAAHWRLGVEIIGDILSAPALRPADIDAEREVILEELWAALDTPDDRVHMLSMEGLFPAHPLGREVLGDADTVRAMGRDDIVDVLRAALPSGEPGGGRGRTDRPRRVLRGRRRPPRPTGRRFAPRTPRPDARRRAAEHTRPRRRAGPSRAGLAGPRPPPRRPVRAARRQPDPRRRLVVPPVPGHPRRPRPGVLRVLLGQLLLRRRAARPSTPARRPGGRPSWWRPSTPNWLHRRRRRHRGRAPGRDRVPVRRHRTRPRGLGQPHGPAGTHAADHRRGHPIDEQLDRIRAVTVADVDDLLQRLLGGSRSVAAVGPVDARALATAV